MPYDISMWNLNYDTNEPIYKMETDSRTEIDSWWPREMGCEGGMGCEFGISRCKLLILYIEWINNKVLLYSTENYIFSILGQTMMKKI